MSKIGNTSSPMGTLVTIRDLAWDHKSGRTLDRGPLGAYWAIEARALRVGSLFRAGAERLSLTRLGTVETRKKDLVEQWGVLRRSSGKRNRTCEKLGKS